MLFSLLLPDDDDDDDDDVHDTVDNLCVIRYPDQ